MPSVVNSAFRDAVATELPDSLQAELRQAVGGNPAYREMHRALALASRAASGWAGGALSVLWPKAPNQLELLGELGRPEDGYNDLQPAARAESKRALAEGNMIAIEITSTAQELGVAVAGLDTEADNDGNRLEFEAVGRLGASLLVQAGRVRKNEEWVVEQANRALEFLIALPGWENRLGPRFE